MIHGKYDPSFHEKQKELGETRDCTVRSLAKVAECSYDVAYEALRKAGRKPRYGADQMTIACAMVFIQKRGLVKFTRLQAEEHGFIPMDLTVNGFAIQRPKGTFFCTTRDHAFVVKDGIVFDNRKKRSRVEAAYLVENQK